MNRSYFTDKLKRLGFVDYQPPGDLQQYLKREYLKRDNVTLALSERDTSIEIKVFTKREDNTQIRVFEDYSSVNEFLFDKEEPEPVVEKKKVKVSRKKR